VQFVLQACQWLADSDIGTRIRESDNLFSAIETVHVLGVTATAGTIAIVDLRVLGALLNRRALSQIIDPLVKITWIGFSVMLATGALLFWSEADKLYFNVAFRVKLLLLAALGVNQWIFHRGERRARAHGNANLAPRQAKVAAGLSLALWLGVIVSGRAIAYL